MPTPAADRNLLFAVLALQNDLVNRDALIEGMNAWSLAKARPLGDVLVERGALTAEDRRMIDLFLDFQVAKHGSPRQTMDRIDLSSSVRDVLSRVDDPDVQASLADAHRTGPYTPPRQAGLRYRVLRPHARGGLGEVFVAEDLELKREVALKEIREQHAGNDASRGRFVAEAEITGRLEHPGIVPVYGLGSYDDGRPFYAMRFVKGDNLQQAATRFHESGRPFDSVEFRQLLGRFIDVCEAVAYAHSRGVLHRDIKPGNVMLGQYGETLVVDWGLAKLVGRRGEGGAGESTLNPVPGGGSYETVAGAVLGSPAYMSPEQAEGKLDDLGPATDVYSLGATLYEVLTGQSPVGGTDGFSILDKVKKGQTVPAVKVKPGVPAALSAVCVKAMALTPADRYPSAEALAADVEHWLADEPVSAFAEPVGVKVRRWVRKHSGRVTGVVAALVVVGLATGLYFVNAERVLVESARRGEAAQRIEAQRHRDETEAVLKFVEEKVFAAARPQGLEGGLGHEVSLKRAVQAALPFVAEVFQNRPLTEARLRMTIGTSFRYLGNAVEAERQYRRARVLYTAQLGPDHPDTLRSMNDQAGSYEALDRPAEALALTEEALKLSKAKLGPDNPDTFRSMINLASSYEALGRHAEALSLREETLMLQKAKLGRDHPLTLRGMNDLEPVIDLSTAVH